MNSSGRTTMNATPVMSSTALPIFKDLGKPELPVINIFPLRRAIKAPVGTSTHQTFPAYSISVIVALVIRISCVFDCFRIESNSLFDCLADCDLYDELLPFLIDSVSNIEPL